MSCCVQALQYNSSSADVLQPIFLNEVLVKLPTDPSGDEPIFHISHIDRVYTLRAESINERSVPSWAFKMVNVGWEWL